MFIVKALGRLIAIPNFYHLIHALIPWLLIITGTLFSIGLYQGLVVVPADYQQGEAFRLIYIHVPCAFLSLIIYILMGCFSAVGLIFRLKITDILISSSMNIGAWLTGLALITGALWGKPMWGTWWIWDARLTSELILLFLYLGVIALRHSLPNSTLASRSSYILLLIGLVNIPIIHYSVYWWNTLHQGSTIHLFSQSLIHPQMLRPLWIMIVAFSSYYLLVLFLNARCEIIQRDLEKRWIKKLLDNP
jgi:heme exporter protein C